MEGAYVHTAQPAAVKAKYREEVPSNIMFDRRIVRGNTYAAQVVTQSAQREVERLRQEQERAARREANRRRREELQKPSTPPPVEGRAHCEAQTESFLEVLSDKPVESEVETQTDAKLDKNQEPLFVPAKSGVDAQTEIPHGDLFDFDVEVTPILEVLVGKTLRYAMIECLEEEELENMKIQQDEFEQMRDAELLEVQRLDAEAARKFAEKRRRLEQAEERVRQQAELQEKIAARSFAKNYFADLSEIVFDHLEDQGHFVDPVIQQVRDHVIPVLLDDVVADIDVHVTSRNCADALLHAAIDTLHKLQAEADDRAVKDAIFRDQAQQAADAARLAQQQQQLNSADDDQDDHRQKEAV
ncbi:hypothetical protein CTAYLR_003758 [Chrysophaeum taylorii]|uniref:Radial spoke protein 3 n=1 Tax=Chrysophaeum taylorii TaxID=2483200 RepID=A0AAD7UDT3_9STRA|nr:hypothetical protein CTAYLR_003758 [Chrysophaeum taylorii]